MTCSGQPFRKERVEEVLTDLGIDVRIRGEALTLEQFALLADSL